MNLHNIIQREPLLKMFYRTNNDKTICKTYIFVTDYSMLKRSTNDTAFCLFVSVFYVQNTSIYSIQAQNKSALFEKSSYQTILRLEILKINSPVNSSPLLSANVLLTSSNVTLESVAKKSCTDATAAFSFFKNLCACLDLKKGGGDHIQWLLYSVDIKSNCKCSKFKNKRQ